MVNLSKELATIEAEYAAAVQRLEAERTKAADAARQRDQAQKAEEQARLPSAVIRVAEEAILQRKRAVIAHLDRVAGVVQRHPDGQPKMWQLEYKRLRPRVALPAHVQAWLHADGVPAYAEYHERGIHGVAALWGVTRSGLCGEGIPPKKWYDFLNSARGLNAPYQHTWNTVFRQYRWVRNGVMPADVRAWFEAQQ